MAGCDASELREIEVFAGLDARARADCAAVAVRRSFSKGESIFHQGDQPARFHALVCGWMRILQAGVDGELSVIRLVGPGDLFGSFALFAQGDYPADAIAAAAGVELSWAGGHLRELIDRHPMIATNLVGIAARRLAELQERVREISTQPAQQRIASALVRLAHNNGTHRGDGRVELMVPLIRKDLAAISATTLYTASRTMSAWQRKGLVVSTGSRTSILKPSELQRIAAGLPL